MKSAARPGSSTPIELPSAMKRAVTSVAARSASAGVKPRSFTKISISRACHSPYGVTAKPESVPVSIGTPALCALRRFSQAISNSRWVSPMRPLASAGSCGWVKSTMLRGNVSVGPIALPLSSISSMHSSSR